MQPRIPPPLVVLVIAAAMWALSIPLPAIALPWPLRVAAALVIASIGAAFSIAGAIAFHRAKTTVNPLRPELASALVTTGIYRISRNPMYVGMALVLIAWAVGLASPVALIGPAAFIMYMNRFQIAPEERALAAKFGQEYAAYRSRVRRWL